MYVYTRTASIYVRAGTLPGQRRRAVPELGQRKIRAGSTPGQPHRLAAVTSQNWSKYKVQRCRGRPFADCG